MRNNEKNQGENKDLLATWITRSSRVMTEKGLGWRMTERGNGAGMTGAGNGTKVTGAEKMGFRWGVSLLAMKRSVSLLAMVTIFPALAQAQVCTTTPDCTVLGYTASSCPDGGVKCPWGNKWFCGKAAVTPPPPLINNGVIDGIYYCDNIPKGVAIPGTNIVMALDDVRPQIDGNTTAWGHTDIACSKFVFCGATKGRLPTDTELKAIFRSLDDIKYLITKSGGSVPAGYYWTSTKARSYPGHVQCNYGCYESYDYDDRPIGRPVIFY